MSRHELFSTAQARRWMRPDAHLYVRQDAGRFMAPGAPAFKGRDVVRHFWPMSCQALDRKYSPEQPRVPAGNPDGGQWASAGDSPETILSLVDKLAASGVSPSYQECLDLCYPLLERFKPPGSDRNQWDFIRCMNACLKR